MPRTRHGRSTETRQRVDGAGVSNPRARQRALAIGVVSEGRDDEPLAELKELLRTAGVATAAELVQRRAEPDPDRYLGRGKLRDLKQALRVHDANLVACDDELAPRQERNLESALGVPVIDRTAVILDIFADHAQSAEGKLQVELAQLEYNLARMRGLWTHLERLGAGRMDGGIGTRGPGESQIETDRRLARDRIATLRRRLGRLERNRGVMRASREHASLPTVALAGYTNAGKSTLLNALTGAVVGVGERLFHTLDPTTRAFEHGGRRYLVTDTVGFIRKLPHQLVEAFKATLEETVLADLIVHVVDAAEPPDRRAESIAAVDSVLDEIGAGEGPRLVAYNKIDLLDEDERRDLLVGRREVVGISAETGEGLDELRDRIETAFEGQLAPVELLVPYSAGDRLSELHRVAGEVEREDRAEGVLVKARIPAAVAHRFAEFALNGDGERPLPRDFGRARG
ncbi:MAG TPA: GTPase HflX [Solirubrobacterales bacterium]|nr:GTPase HflX [Solirubrobacterales bacterium]